MSVPQFDTPLASGLSTMSVPVLLALLVPLCGCRGEAQFVPREDVHRGSDKPSFKLFELIEQNRPGEGVQHREAHIIVSSPESRDDVVSAAHSLYDALRDDIEHVQQAASDKQISILIYDSLGEARSRHREPILQITSGASATLPAWSDVKTVWQWRDPQTRPEEDELRMYRAYHERLSKLNEVPARVDQGPVVDDSATREQERLLAQRIMKAYDLRPDEFAKILATIHVWRSGNTPEAAAIERLAKEYRQAWDEAHD